MYAVHEACMSCRFDRLNDGAGREALGWLSSREEDLDTMKYLCYR